MHRRSALRLHQRIVYRRNLADAMNLVPPNLDRRHPRECTHLCGIALDKLLYSFSVSGVLMACAATRQRHRGSHAFQVPLERPANGFVKIVDVEHEPSIGRSISAKVADMRIAA